MAEQNIFSIAKKVNGAETTTVTNYSFRNGDVTFSFNIQERIWTERLADGSHRVVDVKYVRQRFLALIDGTASV